MASFFDPQPVIKNTERATACTVRRTFRCAAKADAGCSIICRSYLRWCGCAIVSTDRDGLASGYRNNFGIVTLLRAWLSFFGAAGFQRDPLLRIHGHPIHIYYPMQVRAVGAACCADVADDFAFFYVRAGFHR